MDLVDGQTLAVFLTVPATLVACSMILRWGERPRLRRDLGSQAVVVVLLVLVGVAAWALHEAHRPILVAAIACGVCVGCVAAALIYARHGGRIWSEKPIEEENSWQDAADAVRRVGDGLALGVVVVAGLGLVRAFTAPVLLADRSPWSAILLGIGVGVAIGAPALGPAVLGRIDRFPGRGLRGWVKKLLDPREEGSDSGPTAWLAFVVWGISIVGLVILASGPISFSGQLGVVATTVLALGGWAVVFGFLIVRFQYRQPLEVFRIFHMKANPVLTIVGLALFIPTLVGGDPDLHAVRTIKPTPGTVQATAGPQRSLNTAFEQWLGRSSSCDRMLVVDGKPSGTTYRPMLVVAASGGGIRAAYWTAHAMTAIKSAGTCGPEAVLLSSGVSGGSVGLVLARGPDPIKAVERLAAPSALAAGLAGALVTDPIAATTGLRYTTESSGWLDRAGLMEKIWEGEGPDLNSPLDQRFTLAPGPPTGALVLNSTATAQLCRVLISEVDLDTRPDLERPRDCRTATGLPTASLDLIEMYGDCLPAMNWSTAAMLSARFPTITPAGRILPKPNCAPPPAPTQAPPVAGHPDEDVDDLATFQFIDGGYAEGSGIGTVAEIAPRLAALVRQHNSDTAKTVIVPIMVYLEDETRADLELEPPSPAPEPFVPLVGRGAATELATSARWTHRVADAFFDPCPAAPPAQQAAPTSPPATAGEPVKMTPCQTVVRDLRVSLLKPCETTAPACHTADAVPSDTLDGIVIVAPVTKPSVDAPLGWTLSEESRYRLREAMADQVGNEKCDHPPVGGFEACFNRLLDVLKNPH